MTKRQSRWSTKRLRNIHNGKVVPWCEAAGRTMVVRKGALLFQEGEIAEGAFLVKSGCIEISVHAADGRSLGIGTARRGQFLGLEPLFSAHPHDTTARALGTATVCFIPRGELFAFLDADADVRMRILHLLCEDVSTSYGLIRRAIASRHQRAAAAAAAPVAVASA